MKPVRDRPDLSMWHMADVQRPCGCTLTMWLIGRRIGEVLTISRDCPDHCTPLPPDAKPLFTIPLEALGIDLTEKEGDTP